MGTLGAPQVARRSVHDGVGGESHCEGGVALVSELVVIVNTGVHSDGERWGGVGSNGLAVVLRLLGSRSPSEWSVGLGFNLNVPLSRWTGKGVGDVGGVLEAPTLGSFGFRFSRFSPPTFSAAHTDLEYLKTTYVTGCLRLAAYTWPHGVPTSGNREKETGEITRVPFGFRTLSSGVAAVRWPGPRRTGVVHSEEGVAEGGGYHSVCDEGRSSESARRCW